jgi:hypothetical protein
MSNYSEFLKKVKEQNKEKFFPNYKNISNKYFTFDHYVNDDEIVIITSNIITVKGSPVLVVGNNKVVYLKDFCIQAVHNYDLGINTYAVILKRQFFKVYTFKNDIEGFSFEKEESFDDLIEVAKEQDAADMKIAIGHMN